MTGRTREGVFERNDDGTMQLDAIHTFSRDNQQFFRDLKKRLNQQHNDIIELRRIIDKETHINHDDETKGGV